MNAGLVRIAKKSQKMKTIQKVLLGGVAVVALAMAPQANAYTHHGRYIYHRGHYGYYYHHSFYVYNAGPNPYYYGPYNGPVVTVVAPGPRVVIAPRRHRFFIWF